MKKTKNICANDLAKSWVERSVLKMFVRGKTDKKGRVHISTPTLAHLLVGSTTLGKMEMIELVLNNDNPKDQIKFLAGDKGIFNNVEKLKNKKKFSKKHFSELIYTYYIKGYNQNCAELQELLDDGFEDDIIIGEMQIMLMDNRNKVGKDKLGLEEFIGLGFKSE